MCNMKKIISFASDFGLEDGSVGVVKGVINRIDPELRINDISGCEMFENITFWNFVGYVFFNFYMIY